MNRLLRYLAQPQPHPAILKRWHTIAIPSAIVFFILGIFQPFGIEVIIRGNLAALAGYVCITILGVSVVACIFPLLFKRFYSENWTVGKNLLNSFLIILFISLGNWFYHLFALTYSPFGLHHAFPLFLFYFIVTSLVSIVPFTVITFLQHNHSLAQRLLEIQELNQKLSAKTIPPQTVYSSRQITLAGNTKDSVALHPEQLIYLEACGNYVKINYAEEGAPRQKLLRATIKQMEDELAAVSFIVRSHRAFLVNIRQIASVKGNAQGYKVCFTCPVNEAPVSRGYARELLGRLYSDADKDSLRGSGR
ncbi:MAG: LytTR family transcriptional regulator [Tannerellaceae bacterium]|jgi:hypothetical protein|nr:LytTR family transcriptional regulator [Tannerellaceae bacterium]